MDSRSIPLPLQQQFQDLFQGNDPVVLSKGFAARGDFVDNAHAIVAADRLGIVTLRLIRRQVCGKRENI